MRSTNYTALLKMKRYISVILILLQSSLFAVNSPDGNYTTQNKTGEFNSKLLEIKKNNKVIYTIFSGYGGFEEIVWSPNSRYLAIVNHGIKTMMTVEVYEVRDNKASKLDLPEYRLNILGRAGLFEGGRYWFDKSLSWKKNVLTFETTGSLKDGASNPQDHPENWYKYKLSISFGGQNMAAQPRLTDVKKSK